MKTPGRKQQDTEENWSLKQTITTQNAYLHPHQLQNNITVFGWHPYWMGSAYRSYNFSLLSMVAYFSYELDPATGSYKSIHDWKTTALVDSAHRYHTKVLLTVTNFGEANNRRFLQNPKARETLISTLTALLDERKGDGVNIDFEDIPADCNADLTAFVIDLSTALHSKGRKLTLTLPLDDLNNVFDINQLNPHVDLYIMMGYGHENAYEYAEPIAPVSGGHFWQHALDSAVAKHIGYGIAPDHFLVGLPYYGAEWETKDLMKGAEVKKFMGHFMYHSIRKREKQLLDSAIQVSAFTEEVGSSRYLLYKDQKHRNRQLWFEDETSLGMKYDWVKKNKLGGVALWALGYDNGHGELWQLLAKKFAVTEAAKVQKTAEEPGWWARFLAALRRYAQYLRLDSITLLWPLLLVAFLAIQAIALYLARQMISPVNRFLLRTLRLAAWIMTLSVVGVSLYLVQEQDGYLKSNLRDIALIAEGLLVALNIAMIRRIVPPAVEVELP